jgi:hypothetical protein
MSFGILLIRRLHAVKEAVDWAIDKCGVFQNLREAILTWKTKSDLSTEVDRALDDATVVTQKAIGALERYLSLISIKAYIDEERPTAFRKTFEQWFKGRAEICTHFLPQFWSVASLFVLILLNPQSRHYYQVYPQAVHRPGLDYYPQQIV